MGITATVLITLTFSCTAKKNTAPLEHLIINATQTGTDRALAEAILGARKSRVPRTQVGSTPLHLAAANADTGRLKALLEVGADPNTYDHDGMASLHFAAYSQNTKHAQLFGARCRSLCHNGLLPESDVRRQEIDGL